MAEQSRRPQLVRRLNRRRVLGGALVGSAGLLATAAACSTGAKKSGSATTSGSATGSSATAAAATQPKRGGTLTDGRFYNFVGRTMDPHVNTPITDRTYHLWYQGLLGYNLETLQIEPEIAQKWEQPSPTEYIFTMQPGVKWHNKAPANGRALTVDDVLFSYQRMRNNDPRFINRSLFDTLDKVELAGTNQLRVTSTGPDAALLLKLGSDASLIMAPEVVQKADKFATAAEVVGTGPFMLQSVDQAIGSDSARNPDYWKTGLPYLDTVRFRLFSDNQTAYAGFLSGQLDLTDVPSAALKDYLSKNPPLAKSDNTPPWFMPNTKVKPFDDPRVTRALRLLVDYDDAVKNWGNQWFPKVIYGCCFAGVMDSWDLSHDEYANLIFWKSPKDDAVKEALSLLNAAGFSQTKPLAFETSFQANVPGQDQETLAVLVQDHWRRFSQGVVNTQLKAVAGAQATQTRANRAFAYGLFPDSGAIDDPDVWFSQIIHTDASRNYWSFSDPEIDGLTDKQRAIFDLKQRQSAVKSIVKLLADRNPAALPFRYFYLAAVSPHLHDYTMDPSIPFTRQYEHLWLDT